MSIFDRSALSREAHLLIMARLNHQRHHCLAVATMHPGNPRSLLLARAAEGLEGYMFWLYGTIPSTSKSPDAVDSDGVPAAHHRSRYRLRKALQEVLDVYQEQKDAILASEECQSLPREAWSDFTREQVSHYEIEIMTVHAVGVRLYPYDAGFGAHLDEDNDGVACEELPPPDDINDSLDGASPDNGDNSSATPLNRTGGEPALAAGLLGSLLLAAGGAAVFLSRKPVAARR